MADLPYDRELDQQHAQKRRDEQRAEEQRRARASAARNALHAAGATPVNGPPRDQKLPGYFSVGEEVALERARKAAGMSRAGFIRAATVHFVALLDPGRPPTSQKRTDPPRTTTPPSQVDRSASRSSEPSQLERVVERAARESVGTGESMPEAIGRVADEEREQ